MSVFCLVMHILCVNSLKLLSGFFWDKVWLSWWGEVGNPASVLISLGLKFVDNDVVLLWSHHAGKLLLLVIDTTACTHARRSHNRRNIHGTTRYVRLCGKSVWYCCARAYARGVGVKTPLWICYVTKTSLLMQWSLCMFSYIFYLCDVNLTQKPQNDFAWKFQGTLQMDQKEIFTFWWESGLSPVSKNHLTTFANLPSTTYFHACVTW